MIQSPGAGTVSPAAVLAPAEHAIRPHAARQRNWLPYVLALPIVAYETVFILYPIIQGIASSFTRTDVGRPVTFVGLANYQRMLTDPSFWMVVLHTLVYMLRRHWRLDRRRTRCRPCCSIGPSSVASSHAAC